MHCLSAVADAFPAGTPLIETDSWPSCVTCYACTLTIPAEDTCPCTVLGVSCSRLDWLLSQHARLALDSIFEVLGPIVLSDEGWEQLMLLGEQITSGAVAGALWALEQPPPG
jgi:hypothetical protein